MASTRRGIRTTSASMGCRRPTGMRWGSGCWGVLRWSARGTPWLQQLLLTSPRSRVLGVFPPRRSRSIRLSDPGTRCWIALHVPASQALGFEVDPVVYRLTKRNLVLVSSVLDVRNVDYEVGLSSVRPPPGALVIAFVAPPWGQALDEEHGLDLRGTHPPVMTVLDKLVGCFPDHRLLFAIQVYEHLEGSSLDEVTASCGWTALRQYELNPTGPNHGLLLGTRGWSPAPVEVPSR